MGLKIAVRLGVFICLLMFFTLLSTHLIAEQLGYGGGYFYIYGTHTCPHCTSLKDFLTSQYGNDSIYFCDLLNEELTCAERFTNFTSLIGLPRSVPLTIVIKDLDVKAIVMGAVTNRSFWDLILNSPKSNEIPIYVGSRAYYALLVNDTLKFIEIITPEYLITRNTLTQVPTATQTSTSSPTNASATNTTPTTFPTALIIITLLATAAVIMLTLFLRRR